MTFPRILLLTLSLLAIPAGKASAADPQPGRNHLGLNTVHLTDSTDTPMLANYLRTYRSMNKPGSSYTADNAARDEQGWPAEDVFFFLGDGNDRYIRHGDGTWGLRFRGQAVVSVGGGGTVQDQVYDPLLNTTTARIVMSPGQDLTQLTLTNTRRTPESPAHSGVTDLELMRPRVNGGDEPHPFGTLFTDGILAVSRRFQVLRFMDYLATNGNMQEHWSDRVRPTEVRLLPLAAGYGWQGKGGPLEYAVMLCNETDCDLWICLPVKADNDYVTQVARLLLHGSDATDPYREPVAEPRFPPLEPGLKVYVEYANELWNTAGAFTQSGINRQLAMAEVAAYPGGRGPLNYDGLDNTWHLAWRRVANRTVEISRIFRQVFGDDAMMTRVRPLFEFQYGDGQASASQGYRLLNGYYDNADGNFVADPHPPHYYIWGAGAAAYYGPTNQDSDTLTVDQILQESDLRQRPAQWEDKKIDIAFTTAFGHRRVAYEGGLGLGDNAEAHSAATKRSALQDPRLSAVVVANHHFWSEYGGDLLCYFESSASLGYGHSDEWFSDRTPKLLGIAELNEVPRRTPPTIGTAVPARIDGNRWSLISRGWGTAGSGSFTLENPPSGNAARWISYLLRTPTPGRYPVTIGFRARAQTGFKVYANGLCVGTYTGHSNNASATAGPFHADLPGGLASLRVQLDHSTGAVTIESVSVAAAPASYDSWVAGYGLSGQGATPTADPDDDGLANLTEYYWGLHPGVAQAESGRPPSPVLESASTAASWRVRYRRPTQPPADTRQRVEVSADLTQWRPASAPADFLETVSDRGDGTAEVFLQGTAGSAPVFVRLLLERVEP